MKRVSRGMMAVVLAGMMLVVLSGGVFAQDGVLTWEEAYPVSTYGPNQIVLQKYSTGGASLAQNGVLTWEEAYPIASYNPHKIVLEKYGEALTSVQIGKVVYPAEYYSAIQTLSDAQRVAESEDTCSQC